MSEPNAPNSSPAGASKAEDPILSYPLQPHPTPWRARLYAVIFESDTPAGKAFDISLLVAIGVSVLVVMLETVEEIRARYGRELYVAEWVFTGLFTVEYLLRLICVRRPHRYALSFFGIVDLLSILPTFVSLFVPRSQSLLVIRGLRLLRIFRVFKLGRFLTEARTLRLALWHAREKVIVFLATVLVVVLIIGSAMYLVEGKANPGFSSIPSSAYWAVVTMSTVGYGDVTPITPLGKALSVVLIILGYSLIVVPTGIVSAEINRSHGSARAIPGPRPACAVCGLDGQDQDARFCKRCGARMA